MKQRIIFVFLFLAFAGLGSAHANSDLVSKRKQQIQAVHQKLHETQKKLLVVKEREKNIARQLNQTWDTLHAETDHLNTVSVQLRQTKLNLHFTKQRLAYAHYEFEKNKHALAEHLTDVSEEDHPTFMAFLTGTGDYSSLLDRQIDYGSILNQDVATVHTGKAKQQKFTGQVNQLSDEFQQTHNVQNNLKVSYQMYSNIAAKRQNLLGEVEAEKEVYVKQIDKLQEISSTLERQLAELIREEEEKLKAGHHLFRSVGALLWPVNSHYITSPFGWRFHPLFHKNLFHTGVDIAADTGAPVHAAADGVVIYAGWYGGYGNAVVIDHGNNLSTLYAHCSAIYARKGESVTQGETIAAVGSTGYATGPHLHFEVRENGEVVDPMSKF